MAVAPKDPETKTIPVSSNPFPHLSSGQGAQTPESNFKDSDNNSTNQDGRPEATCPHFDGYTKLLKNHLDAVQDELSRLKGVQTTKSGVVEKNETAQEIGVGEQDTQAQEAKIQRVGPWEWRKVKNECGINPKLPILIVLAKGSSGVERRSTRLGNTRRNDPPDSGDLHPEEDSLSGIAQRIAINSRILLGSLRDCTGVDFPEDRNVWLRPFKYLVAYETEIRQTLQDVEDQVEAGLEPSGQTDTIQDKIRINVSNTKHVQKGGNIKTGAANIAPQVIDVSGAKAERDQLRCLVNFMDADMQDIFEVKRQVANQTLEDVTFEHLWLLYRPGDLVYSTTTPEETSTYQAYRVLHVTGGRPILDTADRSSFDPVYSRMWEDESETEEKAQDAIRSSPTNVTAFIIDCFSLDFDGNRLGPKSIRSVISRYSGKRKVNTFEMCPSFFHPQQEKLYQVMVERGRRFTQLANGTHNQYSGSTLRESRELWQSPAMRMGWVNYVIHDEEVHSEVMLDQAAGATHYRKAIDKWRLKIGGGAISAPTEADPREVFDPVRVKRGEERFTDVFDDYTIDIERRNEFVNHTTLLRFQSILEPFLSDDYVMLLPFRVYGYAMLKRKWFPLNINLVSDITPDQLRTTAAGYQDLVLPPGHKKLLQAIVKNQVRDPKQTPSKQDEDPDDFQMDVVKGKGEGLIILLHGAPGVGKTSTAECVAAQLGRPLLSITCGDVSTNVKQAEETLQEYCTLAHRWRCVLLLDEADVFLAKREKGDIARNALVSVFLRVLEYFSGVIILTTNRVGEFDEAFRSRIHVSLYYPKLTQDATLNIWDRSLSRLRNSGLQLEFSEDEIREFAKRHWLDNEKKPSRHWNGRQIKNAFQTALALANWEFHDSKQRQKLERPELKASHFSRVAKTSAHFDDYISGIYNIPEDTFAVLAERDALRNDTHPAMSLGRSQTQEFVPRAQRMTAARGSAGIRDARADESRKSEGGSDKVRQLELELELLRLKQASGKEETQTQGGDDDDEW